MEDTLISKLQGTYYLTDIDLIPQYQLKIEKGKVVEVGLIKIFEDDKMKVEYFPSDGRTNLFFISTVQFILNNNEWSYEKIEPGAKYIIYSDKYLNE